MARKLTGEATENELQELQELLRNHPNEHYTIDIIQEQWKKQNTDNQSAAEKSFEKVWDKIQLQEMLQHVPLQLPTDKDSAGKQTSNFSKIKKWSYIFAAAMLIVGGIWLFSSPQKNAALSIKKESNEVSTKNGSKTKLLLPDSTQVWLNAGSKLIYSNDYGQNLREVKLTGEAYFDVVHIAGKPFIIHTDKMDIKVLGTAFNVKCYANEKSMETSLIRGSIEVTLKNRQSDKIMLKPNEKLVLNDADNQPIKKLSSNHKPILVKEEPIIAIEHVTYDEGTNTVIESSWVENKLVFRAESFQELARQMERWYGVQIRFQSEKLKQIKLTGIFEKETINQALAYLQLAAKFKFTINQENINIF